MSSMPERKPDSDFRARVRREIEEYEGKIRLLRRLEADWVDLEKSLPAKGLEGMFQNMTPYDAICAFLRREQIPQNRDVIIQAVIEGGAQLGVHKEKSINQSISTNVGLKKLKEKNGLVGLPNWPDEKFVV